MRRRLAPRRHARLPPEFQRASAPAWRHHRPRRLVRRPLLMLGDGRRWQGEGDLTMGMSTATTTGPGLLAPLSASKKIGNKGKRQGPQ